MATSKKFPHVKDSRPERFEVKLDPGDIDLLTLSKKFDTVELALLGVNGSQITRKLKDRAIACLDEAAQQVAAMKATTLRNPAAPEAVPAE